MKHVSLLLLCLALGSALSATAQRLPTGTIRPAAAAGGGGGGVIVVPPPVTYVPEESPWSHAVDSLLRYVDKNQIPSGILYDRVLPLAALPYFNRFRPDTSSALHLR